jgi:hypothetical protein
MNLTPQTESECIAESGRLAAQECAAIEADLSRLNSLVNDAAQRLLASFRVFADLEAETPREAEQRRAASDAIQSAVTALQFHDMATQLTGHAQRRLLEIERYLRQACGDAGGALAVQVAQPVGQSEMSAGSVDLF